MKCICIYHDTMHKYYAINNAISLFGNIDPAFMKRIINLMHYYYAICYMINIHMTYSMPFCYLII